MNNQKEKLAEKIGNEASNKEKDDIKREILREGKNDEAADDRDNAGSVASEETPQGREEAKKKTENEVKND